jgi:cation diffusion facilitator family transporter
MHRHNIKPWKHQHKTHSENRTAERNTIRVMWLTLIMMVIEILAGWLTGSMALLADGWHMGTHFFALGIAAFAYWFARKHAENRSYSFGTGKVDILGGYSSAVVLVFVALLMAAESVERFFSPEAIRFNEALLVAVVGLIVNLVSALLLNGRSHGHEHSASGHHHPHHDHNLKAAYLHVLADALTSVFAIIALLAGKFMGWVWLDPAMGVVGALVISRWAYGLLRDTSSILLDREGDGQMTKKIHTIIEADADNRVADLHLWRLSAQKFALILSVVTHYPQPPDHYKALLKDLSRLKHITVEVHQSASQPCSESLEAG